MTQDAEDDCSATACTASIMELSLVSSAAIKLRMDPYAMERRRHARAPICLAGQFMRENRDEFPCSTIDMSVGGVAFAAEAPVTAGERIIAYLAQIGRLQGNVRRIYPGGFAISMTLPPMKRDRLADQLTWLLNRQALGMAEDRRHERITPRDRHSTLSLPNGREALCKIIDISRSGAALAISTPLPVGTAVMLGKTRGQAVRVFPGGVAIEFTRIIAEEIFGPDFRP